MDRRPVDDQKYMMAVARLADAMDCGCDKAKTVLDECLESLGWEGKP